MAPNNRPRPRLTWWMRVRRFLRTYRSPLQLRGTLTRLRHHHEHPWLEFLCLFIPLPTWHFSLPDPVPVRAMLNNVQLLDSRIAAADLVNMQSTPIWRARDTPLRSLYRLYEAMAAHDHYSIGPEVEYFWYQWRSSWTLYDLPDPRDGDPVRYAILACIAEELACAFNWRLSLGMRRDKRKHIYRKSMDDVLPPYIPERAPSWTKSVPAIDVDSLADYPRDALDSSGRLVLEIDGENPLFASRNIVADTGYFYTI